MMVDIVCPHCSFQKSVPRERIPSGAKTAVCPRCRQRFEIPGLGKETTEAPGDRERGRTPSPWERRSELGLVRGIRESAKGILFSPSLFFRKTAAGGGIMEPLAFGIMMRSLGMMFELTWQGLIHYGNLPFLGQGSLGLYTWAPLIVGVMVLCPLVATVFICITSLVLHFLLTILRAGKNGFEATLRAVSYSQATQLWAVIPFLGSFVSGIWILVVTVISLREIHATSYRRVILALLIPFILMVTTVMAVGVAFFLFL